MSYKYKMTLLNNQTGEVYDITDLASDITFATTLREQPGKLTFLLRKATNQELGNYSPRELKSLLTNGSTISFEADNNKIFKGYIFTMGTDATGIYKVTAYDQMRYLKNEDTKYIPPISASEVFEKICIDEGIKYKIETPTYYPTPECYHVGKSLYSIIEHHILHSNINDKRQYFIFDDYGTLTYSELSMKLTNIVIGHKSLLTSYQYEVSIDRDTYNVVKIYRENDMTGKIDVWIEYDGANLGKWGKLQLLEKADDMANEAQIKELASRLLTLKNRQTRTMKLSVIASGHAVGLPDNYRVVDATKLVAGAGFKFELPELDFEENLWIETATHRYLKDAHLIDLGVFLP